MNRKHTDDPRQAPLSRRDFLRLAGVAGAASVLGVGEASASGARFDLEVDVAVAGSGAAGSVAALAAHQAGAKVVVLEKAPVFGGSMGRSDGACWVPGNRFLREQAAELPKEEALAAMARLSFPHLFRPADPFLGIGELAYSLLEAACDHAAPVFEELEAMKAVAWMPADQPGSAVPDLVGLGGKRGDGSRRLRPRKADGSAGQGDELARQLKAACDARSIPVMLSHRVVTLLRNARSEVVGLEALRDDGRMLRVRVRRGIVFATGGFAHEPDLLLQFQPGPSYGGCGAPTNEGDFVSMATAAGARLGHMGCAWRTQVVLEQALQSAGATTAIAVPPGDSTILVNRHGVRVVNEAADANERTRIHFAWDPSRHEWSNHLLFLVYDTRGAELFGGRFPLPAPGASAPFVLAGRTPADLAAAIDARLAELASRTGGVALAPGFARQLALTIDRYNGFATSGNDADFLRGASERERHGDCSPATRPNAGTRHLLGKTPNPTMHPIDAGGPFHAIIVAAGALDTCGGPVTDASGQVLSAGARPIPGLYGAGTCVASPTGPSDYGSGTALGQAITFAAIAGKSAARARRKELA